MDAIVATNINSNTQLTDLPVEIQHCILHHLTFRECIQCTIVSKAWSAMILNWQKIWQCLSTQEKHRIVPHLLPYKLYINGSCVKRIHIDCFGSDPDHWPSVVDFLADQQCNAIQEAELNLLSIPMTSAIKLIDICGDTLSHIFISLYRYSRNQPVTNVAPDIFIRHCPKLAKLTFLGPIADPSNWQPALPTSLKHRQLIALTMDITNGDGNLDPSTFLPALPKLKHLALSLDNIAKAGTLLPSLLLQYCPELTSLFLSSSGDYDIITAHHNMHQSNESTAVSITSIKAENQKTMLMDQTVDNNNSSVLLDLGLRNSWNTHLIGTASSLLRQLIHHCYTKIQSLDLSGTDELFNQEMITYLINYPFPSLTHLTLRWEPTTVSSLDPFLHHFIIQSATNLRYLGLKCKQYCVDDELLSALCIVARNLHELELDYSELITTDGLEQVLKTMSHPNCSLRKIIFNGTPAVNRQLLHTIATSKSCVIDEMSLIFCKNVRIYDFEQFLDDKIRMVKKHGDNNKKHHINHHCEWIMDKIELNFYHDKDPADFVQNDDGKRFLEKLDRVAKEWKFSLCSPITTLIFGNYKEEVITHNQFRRKTK